MACFVSSVLLNLFLVIYLLHLGSAARSLTESSTQNDQQLQFQYHKGPLLTGKISVNLIWYGKFKPSQQAIISDFITSLSSPKPTPIADLQPPSPTAMAASSFFSNFLSFLLPAKPPPPRHSKPPSESLFFLHLPVSFSSSPKSLSNPVSNSPISVC